MFTYELISNDSYINDSYKDSRAHIDVSKGSTKELLLHRAPSLSVIISLANSLYDFTKLVVCMDVSSFIVPHDVNTWKEIICTLCQTMVYDVG